MLMLFSGGVRGLPTEQLIPFDENDFMLMLSPSVGIKLCNLMTDDGDKFKIGKVIESKKDIFSCESLPERMEEFAEIKDARYERFFITNKSPYLFFDEEEQQYLSKTSFSLNLNCSLEIYIKDISGPMVKKEIDELSLKTQRFVIAELKKLKAREVMTVGEAMSLRRAARQDKSSKAKEDEITMETFFDRYSKLSSITTAEQFNRYRKFLLKKYHPDISKEEFAAEKSARINTDFDVLVTTEWYKKLDKEGEGNV